MPRTYFVRGSNGLLYSIASDETKVPAFIRRLRKDSRWRTVKSADILAILDGKPVLLYIAGLPMQLVDEEA